MLKPTEVLRVAILGLTALTISTPALASPGSGITSVVLTTASLNQDVNYNHDRIKMQTKDPATVRVQRLDFGAGAYSGWHHHPGVVIVAVASGLITTVDHECKSVSYGPGSPNGSVFVEGHDTPMEARSAGGGTVYATYVAPTTSPQLFRIEDAAQNCSADPVFRTVPSK